jgi:glycerol uptake facilitator-like aquaporin
MALSQTNDFSILGDTGWSVLKGAKLNALLKESLAEFVGVTVFLTAITASTTNLKTVALALAIGVMIVITRPVSGGHLNPVTSLYFYIKRQITLGNLLAFTVAQFAGALAGTLLGALISGGRVSGFRGNADNLPISYLAGEVVATAIMILLIATLVNNKLESWIPFTVTAWVISASNFTQTGAQANPAVTLGVMFQGMAANHGVSLMVAELAGLLVAIILLMVFSPAAKKRAVAKRK